MMINIDTDLLRQTLCELKKERDNVGQANYILGRLLSDLSGDSDFIDPSFVNHIYGNSETMAKRLTAVFNLLDTITADLNQFVIEMDEAEQEKIRSMNLFS